jgi:acyl-CoA reductase-like NAD-dependent aldehyde dehydrogenase
MEEDELGAPEDRRVNLFRRKASPEFYDQVSVYCQVIREPVGVTAGILLFNWPPIRTGGKTAPDITNGNSIILKRSEQAPLTNLRIIELIDRILPPNVVQGVPGLGPEVPQILAYRPLAKKTSLTGSTASGAAAFKTAASHVIPSTLKLGARTPSSFLKMRI